MTTQTFAQLQLAPDLLAAAQRFAAPTAVQCAAIPVVLRGGDLQCTAPTGQGKTAAFALPLLSLLAENPSDQKPRPIRVLVLAPTRELVAQIAAEIESFARFVTRLIKVRAVFGGVAVNPQMMALRGGAHLVVATPGRLLDLVGQRALQLGGVQTLVLDEADRLLDLGFADEIARVLAWLPAQRQTLLFSATMPASVEALAEQVLRDPVRIDVRPSGDAPAGDVTQRAIEVDTAQRTPLLRHLIKHAGWTRVLVFVATQYASEHVADKLRQAGLPAAALHGQLSAGRRRQALLDLAEGRLAVLVATDLAARGLDVHGLQAVVNHDLPRSAVDYTHRIGRTGRAGLPGQAVSFICADAPGSEAHFRLIEKRQAWRVVRETVAGFEPAAPAAPAAHAPVSDPQGGIKGRRKSKKDKLREAAGKV